MWSRKHTVILASLVAVLHATVANAQVGLQVRNGNLWGATVSMVVLEPVNLRWKWDGVGTPTRVVWQLSTTTSTSTTTTTKDNQPTAQEGTLRVPASGGVYQLFTVTPATGTRLPFYIRVRVENAGKAVYSRWITVSAATRAAPVISGSTAPKQTAGVVSEPLPIAGTLPTGGDVSDQVPLRLVITGIETVNTSISYLSGTSVSKYGAYRESTNKVYAITASVEVNWLDVASSLIRVKATPAFTVKSGTTTAILPFPVWGPSGTPRAIKGTGGDVLFLAAMLHRKSSLSFAIMEAVVLSEMRKSLYIAPKPENWIDQTASTQMYRLSSAFKRGVEMAVNQGATHDSPIPENSWGQSIVINGVYFAGHLEAARAGQVVKFEERFGDDKTEAGEFKLLLQLLR